MSTKKSKKPALTQEERKKRQEKWQAQKVEWAQDPRAKVVKTDSAEGNVLIDLVSPTDRMITMLRRGMGRVYEFDVSRECIVEFDAICAKLHDLNERMAKLTNYRYRAPRGLSPTLMQPVKQEDSVAAVEAA